MHSFWMLYLCIEVVDVHKTSLPWILCHKCPMFVGLHLCMSPHVSFQRM